jgi:general secretion pathway protein D
MKVMATVLGIALALPLSRATSAAEMVAPPAVQAVPSATSIDLRELIMSVGKRSRIRMLIDPRVRASVELGDMAARDVTYPILLSILHIHNFAAMTEGDVVMVVPDANVRAMASRLVSPDNIKAEDAEVVTTIVPLTGADAATLTAALRPIVASYGVMSPVPGRNALLITDRASNIKRLVTIIREIEKLPAQDASGSTRSR